MKVGQTYIFDSAPQQVFDVWGRPLMLVGRHELVKQKDTFVDRLKGRSWYVADGELKMRDYEVYEQERKMSLRSGGRKNEDIRVCEGAL